MKTPKTYPPNTKFGLYYIQNETEDGKQHLRVRQQVTLPSGKREFPRMAASKYKHIGKSRDALQKFVDRLNYGIDMRKQRQLEIQTAFIPPQLMETFRAQLQNEIPSEKDFRYLYNTVLKFYFLDYFIGRLKLADPKDWVKRQSDWGLALTCKAVNQDHNLFDEKVSSKTIKTTIQVANRFMKFLHLQLPHEYPLLTFQPFSRAALKTYTAELQDNEPIGKFITEVHWAKINEKVPKQIAPFIRLMYFYGLRRAESLGFENASAVRKSHLTVSKQLKSFRDKQPVYSILKDKERRNTPHWFCKPAECYELIQMTLENKMHPDTLSERWDDFIAGIGMDYKLHDFRRTFITNALRESVPRDVQLAVGHANLATTMRYAQDDRDLDNAEFVPAKSG